MLPVGNFFLPTSEDKEEAKRLKRVPGLSVWDYDLTTVSEGKNIRKKFNSKDDLNLMMAFSIIVEQIRNIGKELGVPIEVVTYPLDESEFGPGAKGHCHIEGLARPPGATKLTYKDLRDRVAASCSPL